MIAINQVDRGLGRRCLASLFLMGSLISGCGDSSSANLTSKTASENEAKTVSSVALTEVPSTLYFRESGGHYKAVVALDSVAPISQFAGASIRRGWVTKKISAKPLNQKSSESAPVLSSFTKLGDSQAQLIEINEPSFGAGSEPVSLYFDLADGRKAVTRVGLYFQYSSEWNGEPLPE